MRRRRFRNRWYALGLTALAAAVWLVFPHGGPPFTLESVERIKVGMTRAEVEAGLGVPEGVFVSCETDGELGRFNGVEISWCDEDNLVSVLFDDNGFAQAA